MTADASRWLAARRPLRGRRRQRRLGHPRRARPGARLAARPHDPDRPGGHPHHRVALPRGARGRRRARVRLRLPAAEAAGRHRFPGPPHRARRLGRDRHRGAGRRGLRARMIVNAASAAISAKAAATQERVLEAARSAPAAWSRSWWRRRSRIARPTAWPICCAVAITPLARPDSSSLTPLIAAIVSGTNARPMPSATTRLGNRTSPRKLPSAETWLEPVQAGGLDGEAGDEHRLRAELGRRLAGEARGGADRQRQRQERDAGLQRAVAAAPAAGRAWRRRTGRSARRPSGRRSRSRRSGCGCGRSRTGRAGSSCGVSVIAKATSSAAATRDGPSCDAVDHAVDERDEAAGDGDRAERVERAVAGRALGLAQHARGEQRRGDADRRVDPQHPLPARASA